MIPFLILVALCFFGPRIFARARNLDRRDREWADIREWHALHGPDDGCLECGDK
jgi:hypothetical protein